jgi:hypothetical protein
MLGAYQAPPPATDLVCQSEMRRVPPRFQELISRGTREHMAGDVPGIRGNRQSDKREKYKGSD